MNDNAAEDVRRTRLIHDAFARGRGALAAGDKAGATQWLDRAHRLAPDDGTIALVLASAVIGADNLKAATLFARVLASADVRDAWFGLATSRVLMGDWTGARAAVAEVLGRHALRPDIAGLADQVARATGAVGWCGLTGEGAVVVHLIRADRDDNAVPRALSHPSSPSSPSSATSPSSPSSATSPSSSGSTRGSRDASIPLPRQARSLSRPILRSGPRTTVRVCHDQELKIPPVGIAPERIDIRMDGRILQSLFPSDPSRPRRRLPDPPVGDREATAGRSAGFPAQRELILPPAWPCAHSVSVTATKPGHRANPLIGSPISLSAIGRVEGYVEPAVDGLRGWVWCPGDPDADPRLSVEAGRARREIATTDAAANIPGLVPLARPRSFFVPWTELPANSASVHLRGRDGRHLPGSPLAELRAKPGDGSRSKQRNQPATPAVPDESPTHPATPTRRRPDLARWRAAATGTVVLVTHDDGGGVERRVQTSIASHEAEGRRAIVLRPAKPPNGSAGVVAASGSLPHLRFDLPRETPALLRLLRASKPVATELHHFLNHDPSIFEIIRTLGVPYDAHTHDYAWFCPRIALVSHGDRYCGEPALAACEACVAQLGGFLHEDIGVAGLLDRSQTVLAEARRVVAPSHDAAERLARHFRGIAPIVIPHEDDAAVAEPPPVPHVAGTVLVCIAGAIGLHKGFDILLGCARDAKQRALDLSFVVAGTTIDDQRLIDTGRVFVTGPYQQDEAVALIRAQGAALALLPSIWPETWCLGLTELWRAGLRVAAFDIGAPAERIRRTGRGFLLPLGLAPAAINDTLLKAATGRSSLPIRRA